MDYITNQLNVVLSNYDATQPDYNIVELWKQIATEQYVSNAIYINNSNNHQPNINVYTSQRDIKQDKKRDSLIQYIYNSSTQTYNNTIATQQDSVVCTLPSPSGNLLLIIRSNSKDSDDKKKLIAYWLDIYNKQGKLLYSTSTKDIHSKIITGGTLGGIQWHHNEQSIVYIAESIQHKQYSLYDDTVDADNKTRGLVYEYRDSHGEEYGDIYLTRPYIYSLQYPQTIYAIEGISRDISVSQVQWAPISNNGSNNQYAILLTGFDHKPRKLGLLHYNTRPSSIYYLPVDLNNKIQDTRNKLIQRKANKSNNKPTDNNKDNEAEKAHSTDSKHNKLINITPNDHSAMSARVSHDQQNIVYVTTRNTYAHHSASYVKLIKWNNIIQDIIANNDISKIEHSTIVDIVDKPVDSNPFCGLYTGNGLLPNKIWLQDNIHIILHTQWHSQFTLIVVNTITKQITRIKPPGQDNNSSVSLLDIYYNNILVLQSSPIQAPAVYSGTLTIIDNNINIQWSLIHNTPRLTNDYIQKQIDTLQYSIITHKTNTLPDLPFESILLLPNKRNDNKKPGCVVFPHGGMYFCYYINIS